MATRGPTTPITVWIQWGALLISQLIIAGVGFYLRSQKGFEPNPEGHPLLLPLTVVAGMAGVASLFVNLVLTNSEKVGAWASESKAQGEAFEAARKKMLMRFQQRMSVGSALAEAVTIFGFVLFFTGQIPPLYFIGFVAVGVILHLIGFPKLGLLDEALRQEYPEAIPLVR
jgi:hypothetical protein